MERIVKYRQNEFKLLEVITHHVISSEHQRVEKSTHFVTLLGKISAWIPRRALLARDDNYFFNLSVVRVFNIR